MYKELLEHDNSATIILFTVADRLIKQQINLDNNPSHVAPPPGLLLDQNIIYIC